MVHEEPLHSQDKSPPEQAEPAQQNGGQRRLVTGLALAALAASVLSLGALRAAGPQAGVANLAASQTQQRPALTLPGVRAADQGMGGMAQPAAARPLAAATKQIMIKNYAFSPASMSVNAGDTVVWTNQDSAPHTVTVSSGPVKFNSATLQQGQTFSYKFAKAGTYSYFCSVHPDMKASVTVTGSSAAPAPAPPTTSMPPGHSATAPPASSGSSAGGSSAGGSSSSGSNCAALNTTAQTLLQHIYGAHLEESPTQQVNDLLNINQYALTHTVLVEHMIQPQVSALSTGLLGLLNPLLTHVYTAHLEESPFQQISDLTQIDQYVKTHTALIGSMLQPLLNAEVGSC